MTITQAQQLQREWTDKFVVVQDGVPELRRFRGLTGAVKTVNMSGRALVQFDGPVDIGWYDIDTAYLQQVAQPLPKKAAAHEAKPAAKAPAKAAPAAAPAAGGAGKPSPLDLIRKQGAAQPAGAVPAPASSGGGKPSPLDLIRKQGAAKPEEAAAAPVAEQPAAAPEKPAAGTPAPAKSGLSPLDLIRQQGAAKR